MLYLLKNLADTVVYSETAIIARFFLSGSVELEGMTKIPLILYLTEDDFEQLEKRWLLLHAVGHVNVVMADFE